MSEQDEHCKKVRQEAAEALALISGGALDAEDAEHLVNAIADGLIPHVTIQY